MSGFGKWSVLLIGASQAKVEPFSNICSLGRPSDLASNNPNRGRVYYEFINTVPHKGESLG